MYLLHFLSNTKFCWVTGANSTISWNLQLARVKTCYIISNILFCITTLLHNMRKICSMLSSFRCAKEAKPLEWFAFHLWDLSAQRIKHRPNRIIKNIFLTLHCTIWGFYFATYRRLPFTGNGQSSSTRFSGHSVRAVEYLYNHFGST